jgi:hypothetical protein
MTPEKLASAEKLATPWSFLSQCLWIALILSILFYSRSELMLLVRVLITRLRSGGSLKVASFELGSAPNVSVTTSAIAVRGLQELGTDDGAFDESRAIFRTDYRNLFLVHRISASQDPEQLYDVLVYVVPSLRHGSLSGLLHVDYYFGKYWRRTIFRSIDRATGFLITTSAYAPFTCTARLHFSDGHDAFLHRYIDFEMGGLPPGVARKPEV